MLDTGDLPRGIIQILSFRDALRQERELSKHSVPQVTAVETEGSTGAVSKSGDLPLSGKLPGKVDWEEQARKTKLQVYFCSSRLSFLSS